MTRPKSGLVTTSRTHRDVGQLGGCMPPNFVNRRFEESRQMKNMIARLVREDAGQDLVEYAFLVGLIALIAYVGVSTLGTTINKYYGTTINGATPFSS